jgi:6-phosphogluconolactonase
VQKGVTDGVLVFVGSYSQPVPHAPHATGAGLSILEVELATGGVRTRFEDRSIPNPAYLCVDATRRLVYAVSELWDGNEGLVSALEFDAEFRSVVSRTELPTGGPIPSYVSVVDRRYLLVSNYGDGSLVSFGLSPSGHLASRASTVRIRGSGPHPHRQRGPHAHCVTPHPQNGRIYAADLGADKLIELELDSASGALAIGNEYSLVPGSGPRHLAFDPSGTVALVVSELSSRLSVWSVDSDGSLLEHQDLPMLPDHCSVTSFGADVVMTADGTKAFASNRGHDSIARYERTPSGTFRVAGWQPTGATPRSLALTPDDSHLLVANQDADCVSIHRVTPDDGLVRDFAIAVGTPSYVHCINSAVGREVA